MQSENRERDGQDYYYYYLRSDSVHAMSSQSVLVHLQRVGHGGRIVVVVVVMIAAAAPSTTTATTPLHLYRRRRLHNGVRNFS